MKIKKILFLAMLFLFTTILFACAKKDEFNPSFKDKGQKIYLYGEIHGMKKIYDEELKLIEKHYNEGVRDIFLELPFGHAEFLNIWMKSDNDEILDILKDELKYTLLGNEQTINFYLTIKKNFPDITFYCTDVSSRNINFRFLMYLHEKNIENEKFKELIEENNEQGRIFFRDKDNKYREEKLVENFKKTYESVGNKSIIGFYGNFHVNGGIEKYLQLSDGKFMGEELKKFYGNSIVLNDLTDIDFTLRTEKIYFNGQDYNAKYFEPIMYNTSEKDFYREDVWELEDAYKDFSEFPILRECDDLEYPEFIKTDKDTIYKIDVTKEGKKETYLIKKIEDKKTGKYKSYYLKY